VLEFEAEGWTDFLSFRGSNGRRVDEIIQDQVWPRLARHILLAVLVSEGSQTRKIYRRIWLRLLLFRVHKITLPMSEHDHSLRPRNGFSHALSEALHHPG